MNVSAEIVHWVSEHLCPFNIVNNRGFHALMKTGQPEYFIPSAFTVSRDVRLVYTCTRQHITKMLQEYKGRISFTTDAWTSPNHRSFMAFCVHMEHEGKLLTFPLDVVKVAKVGQHCYMLLFGVLMCV